jgi:hypothetical protein
MGMGNDPLKHRKKQGHTAYVDDFIEAAGAQQGVVQPIAPVCGALVSPPHTAGQCHTHAPRREQQDT